jgi:hypothetical protein
MQVLPIIEDAYMEISNSIDKKHGYTPSQSKLRAIFIDTEPCAVLFSVEYNPSIPV